MSVLEIVLYCVIAIAFIIYLVNWILDIKHPERKAKRKAKKQKKEEQDEE